MTRSAGFSSLEAISGPPAGRAHNCGRSQTMARGEAGLWKLEAGKPQRLVVEGQSAGTACSHAECPDEGGLAHLLDRHRPPPGLDDAPQCRGGKFRQEDHAAVGMQEEFDPIPRLQTEMLADGFRDRRLALDCDCGFHPASITFVLM